MVWNAYIFSSCLTHKLVTKSLDGGQNSRFQVFRRSSSWQCQSHWRLCTVISTGVFALLGAPLPEAVASGHRAHRGVGRVGGGSRLISRQYRPCGGRSRQVRSVRPPPRMRRLLVPALCVHGVLLVTARIAHLVWAELYYRQRSQMRAGVAAAFSYAIYMVVPVQLVRIAVKPRAKDAACRTQLHVTANGG